MFTTNVNRQICQLSPNESVCIFCRFYIRGNFYNVIKSLYSILPPLLELEIAKRDLFNTSEVCAKAAY